MIGRGKKAMVLDLAGQCAGSYDERPCLEAGYDPMPYVSRNRVAQPFYLSSERDRVLLHLGGSGRIDFWGASVNYYELTSGDCVYLPAGVPTRIVPAGVCVQVQYKAEPMVREQAHFYCDGCREEVHRVSFGHAEQSRQHAYFQACVEFNQDPMLRRCRRCRRAQAEVDLRDIHWADHSAVA